MPNFIKNMVQFHFFKLLSLLCISIDIETKVAFCVVIKNFVARSHSSDSRLNLWQSAKNFYHLYGGSRCNTYILKGRDMVGSTNDDKYLPKCEQF